MSTKDRERSGTPGSSCSNPAELAAYADTAEPVDEADAAFVDLGFDGDEFGPDSGDDDQIHLDAA
ncbi:hypothetical protein AB0M48_11815 [Lentzea sp. NPDC051208]|uniref:hypothetical protein n=1 Tax=Lentzea sp. NPDC051208 TaxID=3154642 RepID=UPI0034427A8A